MVENLRKVQRDIFLLLLEGFIKNSSLTTAFVRDSKQDVLTFDIDFDLLERETKRIVEEMDKRFK